jgi:predicted DNA-binding transcriptional regulator AlpA
MSNDITNPCEFATLTIDEVATRYRTSRDTVYRWLRGPNDFPRPFTLPSRGIRWTPDQLEAWDARQVERANATAA